MTATYAPGPLALIAVCLAAAALAGCGETGRYVHSRMELVRPQTSCADTSFVVYFDEGSDRLSQPARQLIDENASQLRACRIDAVRVVGLADAVGAPEANLTLSQRRARRVAEALSAQGLPAPEFQVTAVGETGALLPGGREEPVRRRAEVFLKVRPAAGR